MRLLKTGRGTADTVGMISTLTGFGATASTKAATSSRLSKHHAVSMLALAWALLYSPEGREWDVLDEYPSEWSCLQGRTGKVDREVQQAIGGALAGQPADNPMRQAAYARAERRITAHYRCSYTKD